jgi:hypothetical protein
MLFNNIITLRIHLVSKLSCPNARPYMLDGYLDFRTLLASRKFPVSSDLYILHDDSVWWYYASSSLDNSEYPVIS